MILLIDDELKHRQLYAQTIEKSGFSVVSAESATEALGLLKTISPDMIISDVQMQGMDGITFLKKIRPNFPNLPFLLITAFGDVRDAVKALKLGAIDYLEKPIDLDELLSAVNDALNLHNKSQNINIPQNLMKNIVAESPSMQKIFEDAYRVALSDANVLITGNSGTGKEVLASFIHKASQRKNEPFVPLNCAAIPSTMLASELFGHKKGSFTGAASHRNGIFRAADKGTLFLDEIGDMPLELQPSLLRAIETGMVSPLGSDKEIKTDCRLIAATNKNLEDSVKNGSFREDLFYRLNVIAFEIPSLKNRKEDILPLAHFFLKQKQFKEKRFSQSAIQLLINYSWPGNSRELANTVERAAIIANADILLPEHLPAIIMKSAKTMNINDTQTGIKTINQVERLAIKDALEKVDGNRTKAAQFLDISRRALIYKIKRYNL